MAGLRAILPIYDELASSRFSVPIVRVSNLTEQFLVLFRCFNQGPEFSQCTGTPFLYEINAVLSIRIERVRLVEVLYKIPNGTCHEFSMLRETKLRFHLGNPRQIFPSDRFDSMIRLSEGIGLLNVHALYMYTDSQIGRPSIKKPKVYNFIACPLAPGGAVSFSGN